MAGKQIAQAATAAATAGTSAATDPGRGEERHELRAATAATEADEIGIKAHNLRFDLAADIAYHAIREQFCARFNRVLTGIQVFLGTSAVAAMVAEWSARSIWLVGISALAGVLLLVIDPAGAAREHRALRTRLHSIRAGLEEFGETEEALRKARASMVRIAGESPPAYRAVSAMAYNNAVNAMYPEEEAAKHRYKIGFWRRVAAHWLPMRGMAFKKEH